MMRHLLDRWRRMARAARWAVLAGAGMAAYFAVVEPALDAAATLRARAEVMESGLERARDWRAEDSEIGRSLALAQARHGLPRLPGGIENGEDRAVALSARIESIVRPRRLSALAIRSRAPVALGRDALADVLDADQFVQRLIVDMEFEAEPSAAMEVIAELERAPEVARIDRLSLRRIEKNGQRLLQVSVSPEAWRITRRGQR